MPARVPDGVAGEPLDEGWVTAYPGRLERHDGLESAPVVRAKSLVRDCGEVDRLVTRGPTVAPGEGEARFEQAFLLHAGVEDILGNALPGGGVCEWVCERQLEEGALGRHRCAQLVRDIGGKALL